MKIFALILLVGIFAGCDIFETREPEQPEQNRSNYTTPLEREILIQNLINSFSDKNGVNYLKSFSEAGFTDQIFSFVPSSVALSQFQIWDSWSRESEEQYFNNLINKVPDDLPITLILSNENYSPIEGGFIFSAEYSLSVPKLNANPDIYRGSLKFNLVQDSRSVWVIHFWEDIAQQPDPSWSELKGFNY
jgi:hypothetical protein